MEKGSLVVVNLWLRDVERCRLGEAVAETTELRTTAAAAAAAAATAARPARWQRRCSRRCGRDQRRS
eukprot:5092017-Pleurochrysis_carterae.AAC.1